jgi:hypothetical protein
MYLIIGTVPPYAPPRYTKKLSIRRDPTVAAPYELLLAHLGAHVL